LELDDLVGPTLPPFEDPGLVDTTGLNMSKGAPFLNLSLTSAKRSEVANQLFGLIRDQIGMLTLSVCRGIRTDHCLKSYGLPRIDLSIHGSLSEHETRSSLESLPILIMEDAGKPFASSVRFRPYFVGRNNNGFRAKNGRHAHSCATVH
jgi:hypothetical protein